MSELSRAVDVLAAGGVVAAATESLFGLLADATAASAIDHLEWVKPRADKGMPVLLPDRRAWDSLVLEIPDAARRLADAFWPGPLTIALEARSEVDRRLVLDGTIGVRWPADSPAAELARRLGRPLTATSANPSGAPPATTAEQVRRAFADAIAAGKLFVVDEPAPGGPPSTVVVVRSERVEVVREGAIPVDRLRHIVAF